MMLQLKEGFTLVELLAVIAIIGCISAIAMPNIINWRSKHQLRAAVNVLLSDLQLARLSAIRRGQPVTIAFNAKTNVYEMFADSNANWVRDAGEYLLRIVVLPAGVTIASARYGPSHVPYNRFNVQGAPSYTGTVRLQYESRCTLGIVVNSVGRMRIE